MKVKVNVIALQENTKKIDVLSKATAEVGRTKSIAPRRQENKNIIK